MFDQDIIIRIRVDILNGLEEETAVCLNTPCRFKQAGKPEVKIIFIHRFYVYLIVIVPYWLIVADTNPNSIPPLCV